MTPAQAAEAMAEALRSISADAVRAYRDPESVTIPRSDLEDARAALAAYEASAEQGTAWRREAPTVEEVETVTRFWWRRLDEKDSQDVIRLYVDASGAVRYMDAIIDDSAGEWSPCLPPAAVASPAAQVVEAADLRLLADRLLIHRDRSRRDGERMAYEHAAEMVRALTAGTPGKETE